MFYTYAHYRPDGRIFYIGKGTGRRAYVQGRSQYWRNIVAKDGQYSIKILAIWSTEAEAFAHEVLLIACLRDMHVHLANFTNGGEGLTGHKPTTETLIKRSKALRGKVRTPQMREAMSLMRSGISPTTETCAKISTALKGRPRTPEICAKISAALKGRVVSSSTRDKISKAKKGIEHPLTILVREKMRLAY